MEGKGVGPSAGPRSCPRSQAPPGNAPLRGSASPLLVFVGVFELCILKFLSGYNDPGIPAAIIIFRFLYFVLPLVVSLAILGCFAVARRIDLRKD